jgi:hypothetical protein
MTMPDPTAPAKLTGPKRQHYLPEFYLHGFTGVDDCLAVYDRARDEIRRQKPNNTGLTGHLYTITDELGRQRFELEEVLCKIESEAADHLPTLVAGAPLSDAARGSIAHFAGAMAVRTPDMIDSLRLAFGQMLKHVSQMALSNADLAMAQIRSLPKYANLDEDELRHTAEGLVRFAQKGEFDVETGHENAVTTALPIADDLARIFFDRNWTVFKAPKGSAFITCDSGVMVQGLGPRRHRFPLGHGSPDALTFMPVNSGFALGMWGDGQDTFVKQIDGAKVRQLNVSLARRAQRFVVARDDALALSVSRAAKLAQTTWKPRFTVG